MFLENYNFQFDEKAFAEKCGTAIEKCFLPPNAGPIEDDLDEKMLQNFEKKSIWWRYVNYIFFICKNGE